MEVKRLNFKILGPVSLILVVGFGAFSLLLWRQEHADTLRAVEESSRQLTFIIAKSVQHLMVQGRADIVRQLIEECRKLPEIEVLALYRRNGLPAFHDLDTLHTVEAYRQRLGMEGGLSVIRQGIAASRGQKRRVLPRITQPEFFSAIQAEQAISFREVHDGRERLTHFNPLLNEERCSECHEPNHRVRGVVMLSTSLEPLHRATARKTLRYSVVFIATTFLVISGLAVFLRKTILKPVGLMAQKVKRIAQGDLSQKVTVSSKDEMGELAAHLNYMTDSLHVYQEQLIRTEKLSSLGTLASGLAHELNNPLASIAGYAEDLLDTLEGQSGNGNDQPTKVRHGLQVILTQADRCHGITRHLLNFARKEKFQLETVFLGPVLEEVLGLLEPYAQHAGVRLSCDLAPDVPPLWSDATSLQQVFFNLVKNGIEAIAGEGHVQVALRLSGAWVEVTVADTGEGIPVESARKIFDPFFTTKPPGQGTGLGLPISCLIIEGLGGRLQFTSQVGSGTTFSVLLPAQNGEQLYGTEKISASHR